MISSVLVVVILGAVIAAVTRAVLVDEQPATAEDTTEGASEPGRADASQDTEVLGADVDDLEAEPDADIEAEPMPPAPDEPDLLVPRAPASRGKAPAHAARSAVLLVLSVVGLGALTAAVLGALVVAGSALVDQALG